LNREALCVTNFPTFGRVPVLEILEQPGFQGVRSHSSAPTNWCCTRWLTTHRRCWRRSHKRKHERASSGVRPRFLPPGILANAYNGSHNTQSLWTLWISVTAWFRGYSALRLWPLPTAFLPLLQSSCGQQLKADGDLCGRLFCIHFSLAFLDAADRLEVLLWPELGDLVQLQARR